MLYSREVIDLLGAFPGRSFRMLQILRHVGAGKPRPDEKGRVARRRAVARVLDELASKGFVVVTLPVARGGPSLYAWISEIKV